MLRALGRLVWVPIAFLLSSALAITVLVSLGLERITQFLHGTGAAEDGLLELIELVREGSVLATGLTIVPAVALVIIGEVARIRSSLFYIAGGGLALVAIPFLARAGADFAVPPPAVWQVFATAGFAGGWLYWLLAGRRA